jgi:hypothetical protein
MIPITLDNPTNKRSEIFPMGIFMDFKTFTVRLMYRTYFSVN